MAVTGQFWYLGQGDPTDGRIAYINNDNTNHTVFIDNSPTTTLGTGFPQHIAIDWAAGLYYVISNGGPAGTNASVLMGHLGSAAAPTVVFTGPNNDGDQSPGGPVQSDIINTIQIDPYTHHLYVGICDYNGDTPSFQGVRDFTYNTTSGNLTAVATNGGYLFTQTQGQVQSSQASGTDVADPFDFAIDPDTHFLFFTQLLVSDGFEHNSLWRVDLTNPTAAAFQLVPQTQFALDVAGSVVNGPNGFLYDVEVDRSTDLVYFTTQSLQPSGFAGYDAADNHIYFISETANGSTNATALTITGLPGGNTFYPGNMTFDQLNRVIYVESEENGTISTDDVIYVLQLNAGGTSASLINTITPSPAFTNTAANIGGMAFDALATVGTLSGTSTHAVEQGAVIDLLTAAPTITDVDGDHLASATIQITGGTFVSNESSANDDHLFALDGVTQRTSGLFTGTNITISYTVATETLTLTGYDTFANYQTVLNSIGYFTTGDNPTNYGNNSTRTITWQINDGAVGNPSGTVNGASTNVRTTTINIDAVDDPPLNNSLTNQSTNEDTPKQITFSVSDVDADPANQDITVRLQVTNGTLDVDTAVSPGMAVTGDNTNDVLLTGTQNEINATLAAANGVRFFNTPDFNGTGTLTVTTNDQGHTGSGGPLTDVDTITITVTAVADIANDAATFAEDTGSPASILVQANDTFENSGHQITAVTNGAHGTVAINDNNTAGNFADDFLVYTQSADFNGTDTFTYTVTSGGVTETATVSVTINAIADIVNDSATTNEDTAVNVLVQANDTFENTGHQITATTNGAHGTVAINDNNTAGNFADDFAVYTPAADFNGTDTFTYIVTSGGVTETASVTVTINAVADIVGDSATTNEDTAVNVLVLGNDDFEATPAITGTTNGAHGTVTINDNGSPGNTADDFVVYTPTADFNGTDSFTYTVTSGGVTETATVSVTINAVADIADDSATTNEDTPVNILVQANDTFENAGHQITTANNGANGTVTINNNGSPGNFADDFLVYSPAGNFNGTDSFTYVVTSGGVTETATVSVTINSVNDAPVYTGTAVGTAFTENGASVAVATAVSASDLDSADYNNGSLNAQITTGLHTGDTLSIGTTTNISLSGSTVNYDADGGGANPAVAIGTVSGAADNLTVALNANADDAAIVALSEAFRYSTASDDPTNTTRTVTFTLMDGGGVLNGGDDSTSFTANVPVSDQNDTPQPNAPVSYVATPGNPVALTGISFSDLDDEGAAELATFTVASGTLAAVTGGGVTVGGTATNLTLTGSLANINTFITGGNLTFTGTTNVTLGININDQGHTGAPGAQNASTSAQIIFDTPPVANATSGSGTEDQAGRIAITLSGTDADAGDAVDSFTIATVSANGTLFDAAVGGSTLGAGAIVPAASNSAVVYFLPNADFNGNTSFTYTAFDGDASGAPATASVTVTAEVDIANDNATTNEDAAVNVLVLANDTFEGTPAITGTTNGTHGTVAVNNNGTPGNTADDFVVYTPAADFNGTDTFTYTVTSGGATETATVSVTINAVADIVNDSATTNEDTAVNILVQGNDTFEDPAHQITGTTNGAHGTVAINDNATAGNFVDDFLVYTPAADFNGTDSFTYTVTSGGLTETATVSVTVNAVADIADDSATTNEDTAVNILVQGNDNFEDAAHQITGTTNGAHGTVAVNNNGTPGNTADDFVVYTPAGDFNGTDSFTYTVTSGGVTETGTVSVTVNAVVDIADDSATTNEDTAANILVLGNDNFEGTPAITGTTNGAHGTVSINNNGTPGNTADDFVVFTPAADFVGTDSFTYTVTSGGVTETASVSVTITAVSDIVNDNVTVVQDSGPNNLNLLANDTFENPARAITAVGAAAHGTTSINNNGTPGNTADDFVVYSPTAGYNGPDTFTYTVTSAGTTETATVSVTVQIPVSTTPTLGDDSLVGTDGPDTILGFAGDDVIDGLGAGDLLFGNQDDDTVFGRSGNDTVWGGLGNDSVDGAQDDDLLFGNEGQDTIDGGDGANTIVGGLDSSDGADSISSGTGADLIWGNGGADTITAGAGANTVIGGFGKDSLTTGSGNDIIFGNEDSDTISAGDGANLIFGGFGDDSILSGSGNDTVWGNEGNDTMTGGTGADRYVFLGGSGNDQINGFSGGAEGDRLDLQGQTFTTGTSGDGDVVLLLSGGGTIELNGVAPAGFSPTFVV